MNASAGRGDEGITREILIGRAAMLNLGDVVETEAGDDGKQARCTCGWWVWVTSRFWWWSGRRRRKWWRRTSVEVERLMRSMRAMRSFIDRLDPPVDEARSLAAFARVMRKLREQQDTELRWRWVRRVATALAAAAGAGAVRMLSR